MRCRGWRRVPRLRAFMAHGSSRCLLARVAVSPPGLVPVLEKNRLAQADRMQLGPLYAIVARRKSQ